MSKLTTRSAYLPVGQGFMMRGLNREPPVLRHKATCEMMRVTQHLVTEDPKLYPISEAMLLTVVLVPNHSSSGAAC